MRELAKIRVWFKLIYEKILQYKDTRWIRFSAITKLSACKLYKPATFITLQADVISQVPIRIIRSRM